MAAPILTPPLLNVDRFSSPVTIERYECPLSLREKPKGFLEGYMQETVPGYVIQPPPVYRKEANSQKGYG